MPVKRRAPRVARRKPAARRPMRRVPRSIGGAGGNHAVSTESLRSAVIQTNTWYREEFNLSQFPRAMVVAKSFKFYRLKKVEFIFTPEYNTFQEGSGSTKPYMYWVMNRTGGVPAVNNLASLLSQGAKPSAFTAPKRISYKPNNAQATNVAVRTSGAGDGFANIGSTPVYDRWIATQGIINTPPIEDTGTFTTLPMQGSVVTYYGHNWWIQQDTPTDATNIGSYVIHATWEFKDPQDELTSVLPE